MTIGAFALVLLETAPILPPVPQLAAESPASADKIVKQTEVPIEEGAWRNVVIHAAAEGPGVAGQCHFAVDGTSIVATSHWRQQEPARHVVAYVRGHDYNADSIGVFIKSDFSDRQPSVEETEAIVQLIAALQETCRIDRSKVYFHRDLNPHAPMLNETLAATLSGRLLKINR